MKGAVKMPDVKLIQQALKYLATRCDGATMRDGQGFNGVDAEFGHSLAQQEALTPKQAQAALKMLQTYKGQLEQGGFDTGLLFTNDNIYSVTEKQPIKPKANIKKATVANKVIKIEFPFNWDDLSTVKSIPGRKFYTKGTEKYWTAPISADAIQVLTDNGFEVDHELRAFLERATTSVDDVSEVSVPGLKKELFPFQKKGVGFIEHKGGRVLIGDEMGLGKTIQALAWLHLHPEKRPVIIVCPAHLKLNWAREINTTLPGQQNVQVLQGTDATQPLTGDIIIINYDILHRGWLPVIIGVNPEVVIIDEAHYTKNNKALRTKAVRQLTKKSNHVIALTGTPIVNRPVEGFNIIKMIDKTVFPDFWKFVHTYCNAKHTGFGWDFTGASNKEELHQKLVQSIMIRRKKVDVLPDLPAKLYSHIPMEIENAEEYQGAEADFIEYVRETKGLKAARKASQAEHLTKIEALKQLAVKGKMKQAIQWIKDFLDSNGQKLVVFAVHKEAVDALMAEFKEQAVKIDGSVSSKKRDEAVNAFQNDPSARLFIGNIQAAGTGLTLTAASSVAFLELPWTPGELVQAEDRCHRIGQAGSVNVYYLLADNTIEQKIATMLDNKREVLNAVLDGEKVEEHQLLTELMKTYQKEEHTHVGNPS